MSRFSNYLKNKLEEKNLKLEYVSELTDFSFGMIGHYVNARRQPSYKFLNSYFKAFNISTEEQKEVLEMVELDKMPQEMHDLKNRTMNIRTIPVYSSVSAGLGRIPDSEPIDFISIPDISGDVVAVKVSGNSMEPTFSEGDIVVIKKDVEINIGEVGVFFLNEFEGDGVVKRLKYKNGKHVLESDNPTYDDIEIESEKVITCGKVVNIVKSDLSKRKTDPLMEKLDKLDANQRAMLESMLDGLIGRK